MYPNFVSIGGFSEDGYYQNVEADILLNEVIGFSCAALIRINSTSNDGSSRVIFSNYDALTARGIRLRLDLLDANKVQFTWTIGTLLGPVDLTFALRPATCVGKVLMVFMVWNATDFAVGVNGEIFAQTPVASFVNNTASGMFIGRSAAPATNIEDFAEVVALGFNNGQTPSQFIGLGFSAAYASFERFNDFLGDNVVFPFPQFTYLISMQRQGHAGLPDRIENLGGANGGAYTKIATEDSELTLRTSPTHWACPVAVED